MKFWEQHSDEYKKTLSLSIPVIIAQAGQITVGLIDNVMIGQLGTTPFAAASFTNTLFSLVLIFGMGYSFALTPLIGKNWGEKKYSSIGSWVKNGILANTFMGVVLAVILLILYLLIPFMGQPESILQASQDYLAILIVSVVPMMIFYGFKQFAEGIGDTKTAMKIMLWANAINVIANYLFMYGKLGLPELGLLGAGVGTLISRVFMAISFLFLFYKNKKFQLFNSLRRNSSYSWNKCLKIVKLGIPLGGQIVMEASAFGLCAIMMGWVSEIGMAAHQIAITLSTLGFMIYQGLGAGTTIRVSHYKGEKNKEGIIRATKTAMNLMYLYCGLLVLIFIGGRNILPLMFTTNHTVIQLAAQMLIVCSIFQLVDGIQIVLAGSLRGFADARIPVIITFISYFLISLPFSYLSAFEWGFGAVGIWFGFPVSLIVCSALFQLRYKYLLKRF
ncbi:MATE family efflux transporter [Marinifilum caeruleilacunae]|uniref:Multidrug-efflux transporter n=1 Tax=Marinifilum caeruleilacunae TaxID=2499076 RepID=A0ABX1WT78_9BACT|nr:MATE family efflux transporter [Marinifilum caeruleilacunae]NOU59150.1 MATE family efflux transporter [Marinifilum caeruleilacunae]